jgi:hypothetical protein
MSSPEGVVEPVPPLTTDNTPVISEERSIREVETIPAFALRNPVKLPIVSEFKDTFDASRFVIEAFVVEEFNMLVTCVDVEYTKPPLSIFTFPANVDVSVVDVAEKNGAEPLKAVAPPTNPGAVRVPRIVTSP